MGFFRRLLSKNQTAKDLERVILSAYGGESTSGVSINEVVARNHDVFFTCSSLLAEGLAKIPLKLYRVRSDGGHDPVPNHPLYPVLHRAPNDFQTAFQFRELLMNHLIYRGNAYAFKTENQGVTRELIPINPDSVTIKQLPDHTMTYEVKFSDGRTQTFRRDKILHLIGHTLNGVCGVSFLTYLRETLGLSVAAERFGSRLFKNGAKEGAIVYHPGTFKDKETLRRLRDKIENQISGEEQHRMLILDEAMKFERVGLNAEDSQFLATRKEQALRICGAMKIPPHLAGIWDRATWNNAEHGSLIYLANALMPWAVRWEQSLTQQLLQDNEKDDHFFEFNLDGVARADFKTRHEAYGAGITFGIYSPDDCRAKENLNPRPDGLGGTYYHPANLVPAGQQVTEESKLLATLLSRNSAKGSLNGHHPTEIQGEA